MIRVFYECDPMHIGPESNNVERITTIVLSHFDVKEAEITFIFSDDQLLSMLKNKFFNINQLTDVIAFRLNKYEEQFVEGEIYISIPRAKENSKKFQQPYSKEISRLIIHGCLHLMGFQDNSKPQKKEMTALENKFLKQVPWSKVFLEG